MRELLAAAIFIAAVPGPVCAQAVTTRAGLAQRAVSLRAYAAAHNSTAHATEPVLTGGAILTPSVNVDFAPGAPRLRLDIDVGTIGVNLILVRFASPDNLQSVSTFTSVPVYPPPARHDRLTIQASSTPAFQPFSIYTEPGAWTLTEVLLLSNGGSFIDYSGSQLAALFPSLTVNIANPGNPDVTPPTIGRGEVLTPTVSLSNASPYFAAKLKVSDANSGVANVSLGFAAPGGGFGPGAYSSVTSPINKGVITASVLFQAGAQTGTYTINALSVCDVAGNCTNETTPAAIQATLGTTTFQVTD